MIVVDTNIIGYLYLTCDRSAQAEQALLKDPHWSSPLLWRSEFRNVLALYIRKKLLKLEDAQKIMREAMQLMQGHEYEVASYRVLSLVSTCTCSAYDCEFVALAEDLDVSLITIDKQILKQFPVRAISLEEYIGV